MIFALKAFFPIGVLVVYMIFLIFAVRKFRPQYTLRYRGPTISRMFENYPTHAHTMTRPEIQRAA